MNYTYIFRLYPDDEQKSILNQYLGSVRFVYNKLLEISKDLYRCQGIGWNRYEFQKMLPLLKREYHFLREVPSQSLQAAVANLDRAYNEFFKGNNKFPKFKKKKNRCSILIPQGFEVEMTHGKWGYLSIPKLRGKLKFRLDRMIEGKIRRVSIIKEPDGSYYVTMLVRKEITPLPETNQVIGADVGITNYVTLSNGEKVSPPSSKIAKLRKKIRRLHRCLSRRKKGSNGWEKARIALAKAYRRLVNITNDFMHKLSKRLVDSYDVIAVETLNVKKMKEESKLSSSIHFLAWGKFFRMLEYKCKLYGRKLVKAPRHFPSSKKCSNCGYVNKELSLFDRWWRCPKCNAEHDRDINAAINLMKFAISKLGLERPEVTPVEIKPLPHPNRMWQAWSLKRETPPRSIDNLGGVVHNPLGNYTRVGSSPAPGTNLPLLGEQQ